MDDEYNDTNAIETNKGLFTITNSNLLNRLNPQYNSSASSTKLSDADFISSKKVKNNEKISLDSILTASSISNQYMTTPSMRMGSPSFVENGSIASLKTHQMSVLEKSDNASPANQEIHVSKLSTTDSDSLEFSTPVDAHNFDDHSSQPLDPMDEETKPNTIVVKNIDTGSKEKWKLANLSSLLPTPPMANENDKTKLPNSIDASEIPLKPSPIVIDSSPCNDNIMSLSKCFIIY